MRICRCDRCGKELPLRGDARIGYIALNWRDSQNDDLIDGNLFEKMDFCEECMDDIRSYIESLPLTVKPEMLPDGSDDTEEDEGDDDVVERMQGVSMKTDMPCPVTGEGGRHPYSAQKLRELVKEDKSAKEIAEYFGISLSAYYKKRKHAEMLWTAGEI